MKKYLVLLAVAVSGAAVLFFALSPEHALAPLTGREAQSVRLLFLGDVMLDRSVRAEAEKRGYGYILEPLAPLMRAHDIVVFNLEGPVTDNPSTSTGSVVGSARNYVFTFDPAALKALRQAAGKSILVAHLGNNHIYNFGEDGVRQTEHYLRRESIGHFGSPLQPLEPLFLDTHAGSVALVSYNQFGGSATSSLEASRGAFRAGAFTVLYAHWGEEYATSAPPYVKSLARRAIDAGAALVVGSHPHVVQVPERYRGVLLYYSLGNAVFDQYWDDSVSCGAGLSVTLTDGALAGAEVVPLRLSRSRQTAPAAPGDCSNVANVVQYPRSQ